MVIKKKFIPMVDMIKEIRSDLEASQQYQIDKRTVRRILEHL
jgi:hypothetical protein